MPLLPPYIGVTGFTTQQEIAAALRTFEGLPLGHGRKLMLGVLASKKTLNGQQNNYPNRYPVIDDSVHKLFLPHREALTLWHFGADNDSMLVEQLELLVRLGGRHVEGVQLNMVWPEPRKLTALRGRRTVLQLNNRAMEACNNNPVEVAQGLDHYLRYVTDVLIDPSAGTGVPLLPQVAEVYVEAIAARHPNLGIGVAGGLCAAEMGRLGHLVTKFPFLSVDAESKLRTPAPDDRLIIPAMQQYITTSHTLFSIR